MMKLQGHTAIVGTTAWDATAKWARSSPTRVIEAGRGRRWLFAAVALIAMTSCTESANCVSGNPLMPLCVGEGQDEPRLVFVANHGWPGRMDQRDVYTMTSRGTDLRRLTTSGLVDWTPRWSPDGQQIAYMEWELPRVRIMLMGADGSNKRIISTDTLAREIFPSWSPDGRRIVFASNRHDKTTARTSIYVMDRDGGNLVRLTTNPAWTDAYPHWSPDGARIVFHSTRVGGAQLFVMNADGSDQRQVTSVGTNLYPSWSPDGTRIAFSSQRVTDGMQNNGIYVTNADGSGEMNLTNGGAEFDMVATWSADGSEIYFCTTRSGMHIWRVVVGTRVVRPFTDTRTMLMEATPNAKWSPSFAAVGR